MVRSVRANERVMVGADATPEGGHGIRGGAPQRVDTGDVATLGHHHADEARVR